MNLSTATKQPTNPYDTPAWMKFYAANPGFRRSVGAEGVNDDPPADPPADPKPADPPADPKPTDPPADSKPSDAEAALLKDLMKHKEARKAAEAKAAELAAKFGDIDPEKYQAMIAAETEAEQAKRQAEEKAAIERGDFEKLRTQMAEQHEEQMTKIKESLSSELETTKSELTKAARIIEELTVGTQFASSKFIKDQTVYTPNKARLLYGSHFEASDGKVIAYDKPSGTEDRSPLVDSKGNPVAFDEAMRRIIEADPEKDDILTATITPGAESKPGDGKPPTGKPTSITSRDKISEGVRDLLKGIDMPDTLKI